MKKNEVSQNTSLDVTSGLADVNHVTSPIATDANHMSLEGIHNTIDVPNHEAGFWKQWRAYAGPALLISVGYMDPGNWGTDLAAGASFKYDLLWVVAVASIMAIFLQRFIAKGVLLGAVKG